MAMSGGIDSTVAALLLQEQGYELVGVTFRVFDPAPCPSAGQPGGCAAADTLLEAGRMAQALGIEHHVADFRQDFEGTVIADFIHEYLHGRTPNPCVVCNAAIKWGKLVEYADRLGCDYIATGHYARLAEQQGRFFLRKGADALKDQTYFLYRMPAEALARTLFPIGHLKKPEVKRLAAERGLPNAYKKESMGVCFVGAVGMHDFLSTFIEAQPGPIVDRDTGQALGTHPGAIFYTLGQRHGLYLGGGLPYYVVGKDVQQNIVYVSRNLNAPDLWTQTLSLEDVLWRPTLPPAALLGADGALQVRLRHRAPLLPAKLQGSQLHFAQPVKRPAPGQSAVFYRDGECLGGGVVVE